MSDKLYLESNRTGSWVLLGYLVLGAFLIIAIVVNSECWKAGNCINVSEEGEEKDLPGLSQYCEYQEDFYLKYSNEFAWDNTPEFCLALREYLITCGSSEYMDVRVVYDERCLLQVVTKE